MPRGSWFIEARIEHYKEANESMSESFRRTLAGDCT